MRFGLQLIHLIIKFCENDQFHSMEMTNQIEVVSKLRQRLIRLIKLGESDQVQRTPSATDDNNNINKVSNDRTAEVEECVRRLFNRSCSVEIFIQDVQRILNVTIKSSLSVFLADTIPLAHQYLQQHQYDPYSWEIFKTIAFQSTTNTIRLPSLQQARFRLPPSCPQLIDLTSSTQDQTVFIPNIRSDADPYQQKLIHRFARHNFYLNECGEQLIFQRLYTFLRYVIQRLHFNIEHRTDTRLYNSNTYDMTSNVREQIRFLVELNKSRNGEVNNHPSPLGLTLPRKTDEEEKRLRTREYRLSMIEELRQKEANEMACLVLRESRLKRQKLADNNQKTIPTRILRASSQDLIIVMENIPILKRSKTLLYAYANR